MKKYTVTPWRSHADLIQVRDQLYANHGPQQQQQQQQQPQGRQPKPDQRRQAIDRVLAWKQRGNLPHAVESTALLSDAILHGDTSLNSPFSIRAVHSAAFCRFVTGFCDMGRARERSLEPSSMLEVARQIDMPAEFVALRHEATHEEMPGLPRLREGTKRALEWLWRVYWSQIGEVEDVRTELPGVKAEGMKLFRGFRRARREALRARASGREAIVELGDRCVAMCADSQGKVRALADALVEDHLLVPSNRELRTSLEGAYLMWDELLQDLFSRLQSFREALMQSLLEELTAPSTSDIAEDGEKEAVATWIEHVVHGRERLAGQALKWCCLYPGYWTRTLGERLLETEEEDLQVWRDLFEASKISKGNDVSISTKLLNDSLDIAKLSAARETEDASMDEVDSLGEGGWKRAIVPEAVPIGGMI